MKANLRVGRLLCLDGAAWAVASVLAATPASAATTKVTVTCSDGTGYQVGTPALFGQTTADNEFNATAGAVLGITCSTS